MSLWSVIVYGRTYEADYRFLAIPDDFTPEDENWARNYIKATTRNAEQLPGKPRWSLFKNKKHCVIGVTCMVKDLTSGSPDINEPGMTADKDGRPIYVFVGYAIKVNKDKSLYLNMPYCADNIDLVQLAYNAVKPQWLVKPYELRIKPQAPRFKYNIPLTGKDWTKSKINRKFHLNIIKDNEVWVWPNSHSSRWGIWESACSFVDNYETMSLCLGMTTEKDVLTSPFLNATVASANHQAIVKRIKTQPESAKNQAHIKKKRNAKARYQKRIRLYKQRIFGGLISAVILGAILFKGGVIAIIIAGLIGWIIVWVLQKYKICNMINKKIKRSPTTTNITETNYLKPR